MSGSTSTAFPSFSRDQHHEIDAAKQKGGQDQDQYSTNGSKQKDLADLTFK